MERLKLDIQKYGSTTVTSYSYDGRQLRLVVSQQIGTATQNYSTINWTLYSEGGSDNYYTIAPTTVTIDGVVRYSKGTTYWNDYVFPASKGSVSGSFIKNHNEDGSVSNIGISLSTAVFYSTPNTFYGTLPMDPITRMSKLNSVSFELDLQNRENNIESNFSASYTRYNSEFTDDLVIEYSTDNTNWSSLKTINNYTSGDSLSFTTQEKNTLYNAFTNSNDVNLKYYLKTYSGQTLIGNSNAVNIIGKIYDANPTFSGVSFEDTNNITLALTGNSQIIVKGYSNATITIPVATGNKGATIVDYVIEGVDNPISHTGSQLTYTINNCNFGTFNVYARDSRGNTTLSTVIASSTKSYENIFLNVQTSKMERWENGSESATGDEAKLTLNGTIWNNNFGSVNNSITSSSYQLKITDSSGNPITGTTDITPTINQDGTITFTGLIRSDNPDYSWNLEDSYYIYITVADELSSYTITLILNSAIPTMSLSKAGVGIMCAYDDSKGGALQIAGEPYAMGDTLPINSVVEYEGSTVPDGFELVEDYSTSEIKTNQVWIDGKPIYRKVIEVNSISPGQNFVSTGVNNVSEYLKIDGMMYTSNDAMPILKVHYSSFSYQVGVFIVKSSNQIVIEAGSNMNGINKAYIIIEYTKISS